jgi:hypothetical protein
MKLNMRKLFLYLVFILAVSFHNTLFSWDSTAAKYMPLQIGNTWVYTGVSSGYIYYGRFYQIVKVTGQLDTLGKRYYRLQQRIIMINGTASCGIWHYGGGLRIDSASMNLYSIWSYCGNPEVLVDSLRAALDDSTLKCSTPISTYGVCTNVSSYNIFNSSFPSKKFDAFLGPSISAIYAKGIGIVQFDYGYQMNQCHDTLKGCVIGGVLYGDTSTLVGINQLSSEVPVEYSLSQNYPNPFNPMTKLKFQMPKSGFAVLTIFDALGKEIQVLVNQELTPGTYEVDFDGSDLPSGVYYYRLEASAPLSGAFTETKKMVLTK